MTFGLSASAIGLIGAGASLVGGVLGSNAAGNAADTQAASADKATALQREIYNKQIALNDPYRQMGLGAGNKLMTLLGLNAGPSATNLDGTSASGSLDRNALRAQLLPKYTSTVAGTGGGGSGWDPSMGSRTDYTGGGAGPGGAPSTTVDEAGLNAELDRQMAAQGAGQNSAGGNPNDPAFGSLMKDPTLSDLGIDPKDMGNLVKDPTLSDLGIDPKDLGNLVKDPTLADLQLDPGYQFRLDQGNQGLQRSAAAAGGLLSGRAMKDSMRFNQDAASQEYANAFDRFNTNRGIRSDQLSNAFNRFNTDRGIRSDQLSNAFNRFQVNRSNKLNPLESLLGVSQTATGNDTNSAGAYGAGASSNIIGAGNARAGGIVGGANSINNAIGQGASMYQSNALMNRLLGPGGSGGGYDWRTSGNGMPNY